MKFIEVHTLSRRDAIRQLPPVEVDGNLLVGERHIADWEEDHSQYGHDQARLFPAWYDGKRAWLLRKDWIAAFGYCAEGTETQILGFEEGVRLVLSLGLFDQLFPLDR